MATSVQIIKGVEDDIKRSKPVDIKLCVLDIGMISFQLRVGAELLGDVFGYL